MSPMLLWSRRAATSTEYAFIASLISIAIAAGATKTGEVVKCHWYRASCAVVDNTATCMDDLTAQVGAQCSAYWP